MPKYGHASSCFTHPPSLTGERIGYRSLNHLAHSVSAGLFSLPADEQSDKSLLASDHFVCSGIKERRWLEVLIKPSCLLGIAKCTCHPHNTPITSRICPEQVIQNSFLLPLAGKLQEIEKQQVTLVTAVVTEWRTLMTQKHDSLQWPMYSLSHQPKPLLTRGIWPFFSLKPNNKQEWPPPDLNPCYSP